MKKSIFNLTLEIDKFVAEITSSIISPKLRQRVSQEYKEHLEDSVYNIMLSGVSEEVAFKIACESIGNIKLTKHLLSEIHNKSYIPIVLIKRILTNAKRILTSKSFLRGFIITVLVVIFLAINATSSFPIIAWIIGIINHFTTVKGLGQLQMFAIATALIVGYVLFIKYGVQVVIYILSRIKNYFKICIFCLTRKGKIKISRLPFVSLFGMSTNGDIQISISGEKYIIHFIDILFKYSREIVVINNSKYAIIKTLPDRIGAFGEKLADGKSYYNAYRSVVIGQSFSGMKIKKFPKINQSDGVHIIIADPIPIRKSIILNSRKKNLDNGEQFGDFTSYTVKGFLKKVKRIS